MLRPTIKRTTPRPRDCPACHARSWHAAPIRLCVALAFLSAWLLGDAGATAQQSRTTWTGVYSGAQVANGEAIYLDRCSGCHQPDLSGGEDAPELAGSQFGGTWNNRTLGELFERLQRSMPQDEPGSLTTTEYVQLIAFLLDRNGFPEGVSALPHQPEALRNIRFVVRRPDG